MGLPNSLVRRIRGWQTHFPALLDAKFTAKRWLDRVRQRPFDPDFMVLRHLTPQTGECLVDVGSNRGQSIDAIRLYHPSHPITAFEPNGALMDRLKTRFADDTALTLQNFGLSDADMDAPLFVPYYRNWLFDGLSSFDRHAAESWLNADTIAGFDPGLLRIAQLTCRLRRLDDFNLTPAFIKIDVQGFEMQVLKGGVETLKRCGPILMIEDSQSLIPWLADLGFSPHEFDGTRLRSSHGPANNLFFINTTMRARLEQGGAVFA
jgi:FkbM family methyltransferase